jgi:hypothetical protein
MREEDYWQLAIHIAERHIATSMEGHHGKVDRPEKFRHLVRNKVTDVDRLCGTRDCAVFTCGIEDLQSKAGGIDRPNTGGDPTLRRTVWNHDGLDGRSLLPLTRPKEDEQNRKYRINNA